MSQRQTANRVRTRTLCTMIDEEVGPRFDALDAVELVGIRQLAMLDSVAVRLRPESASERERTAFDRVAHGCVRVGTRS